MFWPQQKKKYIKVKKIRWNKSLAAFNKNHKESKEK
jgi:hypothetical protein